MTETTKKQSFFKETGIGILIGGANGLFGGGGGMIAVPLLKSGLGEKAAHATAILVILPVCALSLLLYAQKGFYDFSVWIPTAIGVTLGGEVGAKLLCSLPQKTVGRAFALLQLFAGLMMILR